MLRSARYWILALLLAVVRTALGPRTLAAQPNQPSVVLILMDDLGYGDLGSYGATDAKTPNIDRLARDGMRLTDFYSNGPNCSPTRAALISGRYQQRFGIEMPLGSSPADTARGLLASESSLGVLLKSRGYVTGLVGKWHLGWKPEFVPSRHGFDEFWGFLGGAHDYYSSVGRGGQPDILHNEEPDSFTGYLTDAVTAHGKAFIERHARQPFYLEVAYNATHWPFQPPGLPEGKRARPDPLHDGTRADYVAMLESADRGVGEILATLDRLGLTRQTLVIFTSDNGGEWLSRNAPFFHRKSTLWEGGIRVPALLRWPGRLPAGALSRQVGITMDLTATILAAANVTPPPSYHPEGVDLLPLLVSGHPAERTLFWADQEQVARSESGAARALEVPARRDGNERRRARVHLRSRERPG